MEMTQPDTDAKILNEIKRVNMERSAGNWDNQLPSVSVDIPDGVKLPCPKYGRRDVSMKKCSECDHFGGIVQKAWSDDGPMPWDSKYAVLCKMPLERTVTMLVD